MVISVGSAARVPEKTNINATITNAVNKFFIINTLLCVYAIIKTDLIKNSNLK
jgi:hypothetical protein